MDHYIALDWAQSNSVVARMTSGSALIKTTNIRSDVREMQLYLSRLRGKKVLTFEETTTAQWLYVELKDLVDEILICDPYCNHLLNEGPKTDKIDAEKLVKLLKAGLLKPVFHTANEFIELRKLISGYEDTVKAGVRFKNQRAAVLRGRGQLKNEKLTGSKIETFVVESLDRVIASYESEKKRYEHEMETFKKKHRIIRCLDEIFGLGTIGAVKVTARVVDGRRFSDKGKWLSYCGLVKLEKRSGDRSYGWRQPRYCRTLKSVFKSAAMTVLKSKNPFRDYYDFLIMEKSYPESKARNAVARKIAIVAWAMMKTGEKFNPEKIFKK